MPNIFISYRRSDSAEVANRIWERMTSIWGEEKVIKDTDSFIAGPDFRNQMSQYIRRADVVLVIIGQNWLGVNHSTGRSRLFDTDDPVRTEIEEAIRFKRVIIPVLINDRQMPELADLPDSLKDLRYYNAFRLRDDANFDGDLSRLNGYFINPELIAIMGKESLPSDVFLFEERDGPLAQIIRGARTVLCCVILIVYWLLIGYTTPWIFPPSILRLSGSNRFVMTLWGDDAGLERFKVLIVVCALTADWLIVGTIVSRIFHSSLFPVSDFTAAMLFGTLQILVAVIVLFIGRTFERGDYVYRNVINTRKTLLVLVSNGLLTYGSSFAFLGISYLYFPALASVLSASLYVYTLIGIGLASYNDNLSGINRVLAKRQLLQARATLLSREYFERRKARRSGSVS